MKDILIFEKFDKMGEDGLWKKMWNSPNGIVGVKKKHHSISYQRWKGMNSRTGVENYFTLRPNYSSVENRFRDFQEFVEWSSQHVGYLTTEIIGGVEKFWHLDKDILTIDDEKFYSCETCLFVPQRVNLFTVTRSNKRGEHPIGVAFDKRSGIFIGQISTNGKPRYLGSFKNSFDAHRAWQKAKIEYGLELIKEFEKSHTKLSQGLENWIQPLVSDYRDYKESVFI